MASKKILCISILIAIFAAVNATTPATRDWIIGDKAGWNVGVNITDWSNVMDVIYGDKLIFNYPAGKENVVEVDGNSYATCTVPPNAKVLSSGHDVIPMDIRGRRCFISGVENGQHCKAGLKFCIYIPEPVQNAYTEYIVGDDKGWTTNVDFQAWAKDKEFNLKDVLVFKYPVGKHNVIEVDEAAVNQCKIPAGDEALDGAYTQGEDQIFLVRAGPHGFISGIEKDCENGMKLLINVVDKKAKPALKGARKLVPKE